MIFYRVFNRIFSTYSNIAVLRALQHNIKGLSGREVSRNAGITARSALNALTNLESLKLVNRTIGGRDHLFTLNRKHYLVQNGILPLLESENNFLQEVLSLIKKRLSKKATSVILFGSVARKEERTDSDLDICIVVPTKTVVKEINGIVHELFGLISENFGATLGTIILQEEEFRRKGLKGLSPANSIIKEGIQISGRPINLILYGKTKQPDKRK